LLDTVFLLAQADEVASLAADVRGQLTEARDLEPLTAAKLALDLAGVVQTLVSVADRLDVATAPAGEPDGGQQP